MVGSRFLPNWVGQPTYHTLIGSLTLASRHFYPATLSLLDYVNVKRSNCMCVWFCGGVWCVHEKIYVRQVLSTCCFVYKYENDCLCQCKSTCTKKHHRWDEPGKKILLFYKGMFGML